MRTVTSSIVLSCVFLLAISVASAASPDGERPTIQDHWRESATRLPHAPVVQEQIRVQRAMPVAEPTEWIEGDNITIRVGATPGFVRLERDGFPPREVTYSDFSSLGVAPVNTLTIVGTAAAETLTITLSATFGTGTLLLEGCAGCPFTINYSAIAILNFDGGGGGDTLVVIGAGGETCTYLPDGTTTGNGSVACDAFPVNFSNLTPVIISGAGSLTVITPNSNDVITVDSPAASQNRISGTSGGVAIEAVTFFDIPTVLLDLATNDGGTPDDVVDISGPLVASLLTSFTVDTGAGNDALGKTFTPAFFDPHVVVPVSAGAGSILDFFGGPPTIDYMDVEQIFLAGQIADGDAFGVDGTTGDDSMVYTTAATSDQGTVTGTLDQNGTPFPISVAFTGMDQVSGMGVNGFFNFGGVDDFTFVGTGNADEITVDELGLTDVVAAALYADLFLGSFAVIQVNAGDGEDVINVTPSIATAFTIFGGDPGPPASPGDGLGVDDSFTTNPVLTSTGVGEGTYTFDDRETITFFEIESAAAVGFTAIPAVTPLGLMLMAMLMVGVAWRFLR